MNQNKRNTYLGDLSGAFADGAILFPLLALLASKPGFDSAILLASAGVAYWVSGVLFKVPISVQPLKSVVIVGIASGASSLEIQVSGLILGLVCLLLCQFQIDSLAKKVPYSLVQSLQLGLGILIIIQGLKIDSSFLSIGFALIILGFSTFSSFPVLGLLATFGFIYAIASSGVSFDSPQDHLAPISNGLQFPRWELVFSLVLPQLVLTLGNSVIGTYDVCHHYFGEKAFRVTPKKLLYSIGIGNIISGLVGGLPYCHGSGGVTAHFRGGATHWRMNKIIGSVLLLMALFQALVHPFSFHYPPLVLSTLLLSTGAFHLALVKPTWKAPQDKWGLVNPSLSKPMKGPIV